MSAAMKQIAAPSALSPPAPIGRLRHERATPGAGYGFPLVLVLPLTCAGLYFSALVLGQTRPPEEGRGKRGAMHLDTEKALTALMTVAIAGVGPACIGLMLLL